MYSGSVGGTPCSFICFNFYSPVRRIVGRRRRDKIDLARGKEAQTHPENLFSLLLGRAGSHGRARMLHRWRSLHRRHIGLCVFSDTVYTRIPPEQRWKFSLGLCTVHVEEGAGEYQRSSRRGWSVAAARGRGNKNERPGTESGKLSRRLRRRWRERRRWAWAGSARRGGASGPGCSSREKLLLPLLLLELRRRGGSTAPQGGKRREADRERGIEKCAELVTRARRGGKQERGRGASRVQRQVGEDWRWPRWFARDLAIFWDARALLWAA